MEELFITIASVYGEDTLFHDFWYEDLGDHVEYGCSSEMKDMLEQYNVNLEDFVKFIYSE